LRPNFTELLRYSDKILMQQLRVTLRIELHLLGAIVVPWIVWDKFQYSMQGVKERTESRRKSRRVHRENIEIKGEGLLLRRKEEVRGEG